MQIFATSKSPEESAKALDDKRVNKMLIESVQILSTIARMQEALEESEPENLYKATHKNHPCVLWASYARNFLWLFEHATHLSEAYMQRFKKDHKSSTLLPILLNVDFTKLKKGGGWLLNLTLYQDLSTPLAYRKLLCEKWKEDRDAPRWAFPGAEPFWKKEEGLNHEQ